MSNFYLKKSYGDLFNLSSKDDFLLKDADLKTCIFGVPVLSPLIQGPHSAGV